MDACSLALKVLSNQHQIHYIKLQSAGLSLNSE